VPAIPIVRSTYTAAQEDREAQLRGTRRRVILQAAQRVFARDGLRGATMRAIASAAGCTTGAIYPLFSSKEDVYAALLAHSLSRLHEAVARHCKPSVLARHRLRRGALAFLGYYQDRPDEVTLGLYLWNGVQPLGLSRDRDAELNRQLGDTIRLLENAIKEAGCLQPAAARLEAAALFAFLIGALVAHQTHRLRIMKSSIDQIAELHLRALVKRLAETGNHDR
jgi:TetR/AcrR family transcriptional regulator